MRPPEAHERGEAKQGFDGGLQPALGVRVGGVPCGGVGGGRGPGTAWSADKAARHDVERRGLHPHQPVGAQPGLALTRRSTPAGRVALHGLPPCTWAPVTSPPRLLRTPLLFLLFSFPLV